MNESQIFWSLCSSVLCAGGIKIDGEVKVVETLVNTEHWESV